MKQPRVLIYGAGHLGSQVVHHLRHYCEVSLAGFVDDTRPAGSEVIGDLRCIGSLTAVRGQTAFEPSKALMVFAIGYADMLARGAALRRVQDAGYALYSVIHPRALLETGSRMGPGCIVLGGAIVDQNVTVGAGCFLDIGVRIGEGSVIGDNNYFSSGAAIGGGVRVGQDCFFGMDCTTTTGVQIGSNCFINAKSLVARNLGDDLKLVEVHKSRELPMPTDSGLMLGRRNDYRSDDPQSDRR